MLLTLTAPVVIKISSFVLIVCTHSDKVMNMAHGLYFLNYTLVFHVMFPETCQD
jgi:hypothetical protein